MRHLIAVTLLAGCAGSVPFDNPCACVVIPVANGAASMMLAGRVITFSEDSAGDTPEVLPVAGEVYGVASGADLNGFSLYTVTSGLDIAAAWTDGDTFDMAAPARITRMEVATYGFAGVTFDDAESYDLGPRGGTVTLREIVAEGDGWRLRGSYRAEVCRTHPEPGPCVTANGNFAFSEPSLPEGGLTGALVPAG